MPPSLRLALDPAPSPAFVATLGQASKAFHAETVPLDTTRFAFTLRDPAEALAAAIACRTAWQWLFVEALHVAPEWRGQGLGQRLLAQAEAHASGLGCRHAWLDTFQARGFYERQGYSVFGELPDYPPGQSRFFLRKALPLNAAETAPPPPPAPF